MYKRSLHVGVREEEQEESVYPMERIYTQTETTPQRTPTNTAPEKKRSKRESRRRKRRRNETFINPCHSGDSRDDVRIERSRGGQGRGEGGD